MSAFLEKYGWSLEREIGADASPRRYYRVSKNGRSAVFMEASAARDMRGHKLCDFIRIGAWLHDIGLNAPEIYECDEAAGLAIIEDFGDRSFKKAMEQGSDEGELYHLGAEILAHLAAQDCPLELPAYRESHVHAGRSFLLEHYYPTQTGQTASTEMVQDYLEIWDRIEARLLPCPQGFMHIDFHAENLMYLPENKGLKRCGILDFQGAMRGPAPYDLVNLLEDVRRDVPEHIRAEILARHDDNFKDWYRVLGTQFHCRVIGQFVKMAKEGKPQYLGHIPRIARYIEEALKDPLLTELKDFCEQNRFDWVDYPARFS